MIWVSHEANPNPNNAMLLSNGTFHISSARLVRSTERAMLVAVSIVEPDPCYGGPVSFAEYEREVWLPISKIEEREDREDGTMSLVIPGWLARDRELYCDGNGGRLDRVWSA